MALTLVESLVLWGVPVVTILVSLGYYLRWGKEADERGVGGAGETEPATEGGAR